MNYKQEEKNKRNIDFINIALVILICVPILFANNYIRNSLHQSELLNKQTKNIDELKSIYLELNSSKSLFEQANENANQHEKLSKLREIKFNLEYIKQLHEPKSLRNDLIKLVLSVIIAVLLNKILINRKNKLKKIFE